ncbi:MAG: hypothetical protein ACLFO2_03715 [Candidatus Woesearchaeota archaeon]
MTEDISKNTLLVLVVLTIVVSLLGTWTVINEASKVRVADEQADDNPSTTGKVSLSVKEAPEPVGATGQVVLNIINEGAEE